MVSTAEFLVCRTPVALTLLALEADSDLVCQPGARWVDINDTLKKKGTEITIYEYLCVDLSWLGIPLFFPVRLFGSRFTSVVYACSSLILHLERRLAVC